MRRVGWVEAVALLVVLTLAARLLFGLVDGASPALIVIFLLAVYVLIGGWGLVRRRLPKG